MSIFPAPRKRRRDRQRRENARRSNPPAGFDTGGWRCADCGRPCYAFGHLHADGTWHDAQAPSGRACTRCHGDGTIPINPGWPDPQTEDDTTCPDCAGTGRAA